MRRARWKVGLALVLALACALPAAAQQPQSAPTRPRLRPATGVNRDPTGAAPSPTRSPLPATVTPPAAAPATPPIASVRGVNPPEPSPGGELPGSPPIALVPAPVPPPTLGSAVQSRWSRPATISRSTTGQCREQCALQRNVCANGEGDTSQCDPGWTRCLSDCEGLSYGRAGP